MTQVPSLLLGVWGMLVFWLAGNKSIWAWRLGLLGQVWWASYAIWLSQYGLLISCFFYGAVYIRNWIRWHEEAVDSAEPVVEGLPSGHPMQTEA